ncbi:MAG: gliding motility protein GldM [Muribaculaceae bacterium]|nr:gliding motility protein GldM [Muribaculaceae bacterium]
MGTSNTRLSPRQKMINLMYIVLMAMLALNVSSDVLDGFTQVKEGLSNTNEDIEQRNASIMRALEAFSIQNPEKGTPWFQKALEVRKQTGDLYTMIDSLKSLIVIEADGYGANPDSMINRENLEAASAIMLDPVTLRGSNLRQSIDSYRDYVTSLIGDSLKRQSISRSLSTASVQRPGQLGKQLWEEYKFDNQPAIAAVTLLTKLQNDIKFAEGEALQNLYASVDAGDVRVNELNAFVIPDSRYVMRGGKYRAQIVLAAIDTTQRPTVFINGTRLGNDRGLYEVGTGSTGDFTYKGYLQVPHGDGTFSEYNFSSSYTVMEPSATVSATMMNVLYAGIDNPIAISVPGVDNSGVSASMSNGTLTRSGSGWVARPAKIGEEATITVTASVDGQSLNVGSTTFRVRKLPDPTPFIRYTDSQGASANYMGGGRGLPKGAIVQSAGLGAAIDDGILNIPFKVTGFETIFFDSMGNAMPEKSDGAAFSERQRQRIKGLKPRSRFFITRVQATGPDGITRELSPIEVLVQ